jgi:hypothetical protein
MVKAIHPVKVFFHDLACRQILEGLMVRRCCIHGHILGRVKVQSIGVDRRTWPEEHVFKVKLGIKAAHSWCRPQASSIIQVVEIMCLKLRQAQIDPAMAHG